MSSIQTPVVYVEHSGRWGTLCKVNQVVTPNSLPNVNHFNMDTLWSKHPEPAHPDRDPVCLNCICGHSQPQNLEDFWSSDAGSEFLDKWFKIPKICQYFRTRSPVTMTGIDGWHTRDIIVPLFFNDNTDLHNRIRKYRILPYLTGSFHPSFVEEYSDGLLMTLEKQDGYIRPILCGEIWCPYFPILVVIRRLSGMKWLSCLLLHIITLSKLQVSSGRPSHCLFFYFCFLAGVHFFQKKIKKNFIFSLFFLSVSLSFSFVHTLWVLFSLMNS